MSTIRAQCNAVANGWSIDLDVPTRWTRSGGGRVGVPDAHLDAMYDHDDKCRECRKWIEYGYNPETDRVLRTWMVCHDCHHHLEHIERFDDARDVVVARKDGGRAGYNIRTVSPSANQRPRTNPGLLGMAGRLFIVEFANGETVFTHDLWCWSTAIPRWFWTRLPINAVFRGYAEKNVRIELPEVTDG